MKIKTMKTKLVDCINQEISGRKYGHNNNGKGRLKAVSKNIDYLIRYER